MNNKHIKRIVAAIVTTVLFLTLLPTGLIPVSAASSGTCGDNLTWELDSAANLTISGKGAMWGYRTNTTNDNPTPWGSGIKTVTINTGVTHIGDRAFYRCTKLTRITIPDGVTSIGDEAFSGCTELTRITIPDSVTSIGDGAFYNTGYYNDNANWEKLALYIGNWFIAAKSNYRGGLTIKSGTVGIGGMACTYRTGLTGVTIPDSVTSIGSRAFSACTGLTSVTIPNSVTSIGDYAFGGCTKLTSVTIPNSVTSIGEGAFNNTGYYNNEANWEDRVLYIGNWLIDGSAYSAALSHNTIKSGTVGISGGAFYRCTGLTSFIIPNSVKYIGERAFYDCTGLKSVTIPDSVTSIGESVFYGCTGLTSVTIPDSVTNIGNRAFEACTGLTSVTIGSGATSIGERAFYGCTGLTSVTIGNGATTIGGNAFYGCTGLTSVTIPGSVTSIGWSAFQGCTGLTSVAIGNGVKRIGGYAFGGCDSLRRVSIPESVESIGNKAFYGCADLARISISGAPVIGAEAFAETSYYNNRANWQESYDDDYYPLDNYKVSALYIGSCLVDFTCGKYVEKYEIVRGTVAIAASVFDGCANLTAVTIPRSVTAIGDDAFKGCTSITLNVTENSCGHRYAKENGIRYSLNFLMLGDPDDDGIITVSDALAALRIAAKLVAPTDEDYDILDIDGDGKIAVNDALAILRVAAKLVDSL